MTESWILEKLIQPPTFKEKVRERKFSSPVAGSNKLGGERRKKHVGSLIFFPLEKVVYFRAPGHFYEGVLEICVLYV